jgi:hypothetical protein
MDEASRVIANRNIHLHESEESDCLNQLREKTEQYKQQSEMYKTKYKQATCKLSGDILKLKLKCIKQKMYSQKEQRRGVSWSTNG